MNVNLKFLLCGAAVWLFPQYAAAQCAVTDCQQLGYTSLKSCTGGLKCPFGEYWACPEVTKAELGSCNGYAKNCKIGDVLNRDGTCTTDKVSGKTPIGVVAYIGTDNCGQAFALENWFEVTWATEEIFIKSLAGEATKYDSCGNTKKIIETGDSTKYPAAWSVYNYAPVSAPETKGLWCLPEASIVNWFSTIAYKANTVGGNVAVEIDGEKVYCWSSTQSSSASVHIFAPDGNGSGTTNKYDWRGDKCVWPVIEF